MQMVIPISRAIGASSWRKASVCKPSLYYTLSPFIFLYSQRKNCSCSTIPPLCRPSSPDKKIPSRTVPGVKERRRKRILPSLGNSCCAQRPKHRLRTKLISSSTKTHRSNLIQSRMDSRSTAALSTRPRQFGKALAMSMVYWSGISPAAITPRPAPHR